MHTSNNLTQREREVHHEIVEGKSNMEIARDLCIAPSTAKNHVHNILIKLDASSRTEVIVNHYKAIIEGMTIPGMNWEQ